MTMDDSGARASDLDGNDLFEPDDADAALAELTYRQAVEVAQRDASRRYLRALMRRFEGSVSAAAEHAELERESLYRLLRRHGVNPEVFKRRG